ncbi:MAG: hypothetical protein IVW57_12190, partial [Ktedonobacterales bacterium]|nr:hypothetical protein [Ktedonobacterales bacterium]
MSECRKTLTQVAADLGVTPNTLKAHLKALNIVPVTNSYDRRGKVLTCEEIYR